MIGQTSGAIINISSTASVQNQPASIFSYCASKSGVNHLTRALAVHCAPYGIRANAVLPGAMDSPLIYQQIAGQFRNTAEMIRSRNAASPMGHMGTAWDVAHAALFLASEEANTSPACACRSTAARVAPDDSDSGSLPTKSSCAGIPRRGGT
jgi:NAD(P)-dependent dehydrogenase (short-subunit alcohol dehydrogenase family)